MKYLKLAISSEAPSVKDVVWAKPVTGGFALYLLEHGVWQPLISVDDNNTSKTVDDVAVKIKTKADKVSSATNGNLASLNSNGNLADSGKSLSDLALLGTDTDDKDTMTLYGLKAYIDDAIQNAGG